MPQRRNLRASLPAVRQLRAEGKSLTEIGRLFGVSRQAVHDILTRQPPVAACSACGASIPSPGYLRSPNELYCMPCLADRPDVPFPLRLKSVRIAARLTQQELARRAGMWGTEVKQLEKPPRRPAPIRPPRGGPGYSPETLRRLVEAGSHARCG